MPTRQCSVVAALVLVGALSLGCDGPEVAEEEAPAKASKKAEKKAEPEPEPEPEVEVAREPEPEAEVDPAAVKLPKTPATVEEAVATAKEMYADHRRDFFCGCTYGGTGKLLKPSCGYRTRADESLAKKIDWDRVVPVRAFGAHRPCWKSPMCTDANGTAFSGVQCCREKDPVYRAMEADLHNIVPVIAELNEDRGNFPYGEVSGESRLYGACDVEVDRGRHVIEPPESVRGDIARIHLYMRDVYGDGLPLTAEEIAMFEQWNGADPPDAWEVDRNRRVATVQGRANDHLPMRLSNEAAEPPKGEAPPPAGDGKAEPGKPAGEAEAVHGAVAQ